MLVEDDDRGKPRYGCPGGSTGTHDDVDSCCGGGPLLGHHRHAQPEASQTCCCHRSPSDRRGHDEQRTAARRGRENRQHRCRRGSAHHSAAEIEEVFDAGVEFARCCDAPAALPWKRLHGPDRRGRRQHGSQRAGPPVGGPSRQLDELRRRPVTGHLGDGLQLDRIDPALTEPHHPATDAPPVQRDANQGPDAHLVPEALRDQVVEFLVEATDVRDDPCRERPDGRHQTPSAALNSASLEVCSHVKSASGRPK